MNGILARKIVRTVLPVMAGVFQSPEILKLPLDVQIKEEAETASTQEEAGRVCITLPVVFNGISIEQDTGLYLGLAAHELGHLPNLQEVLRLVATAAASSPALRILFNIMEDIRIESLMRSDPVNAWLTRVRELCTADLPENPENFWDLIYWLRFGNPQEPFNLALPATAQSYENFWMAALDLLRLHLPHGPQGSFRAARAILELTASYGLEVPTAPESWLVLGLGPGIAAGEGCEIELPENLRPVLPDYSGGAPCWEDPDVWAIAEGRRLAGRLKWWTQGRSRQIAGGVGKYNPRLESSGLPPYTLPLAPGPAAPPRLAVFLDISDSMWAGSTQPAPLSIARAAAIALVQAAEAAGGEVRVWAFCHSSHALFLGRDIVRIASVRGFGTRLAFLADVLARLPNPAGWHFIFITDAETGRPPAVWDKYRDQATVLHISDDQSGLPERLGRRVIPIRSIEELPVMTALAARSQFAGAVRG